jgi:[acyl-carrier-protein] S-malonyltransferase
MKTAFVFPGQGAQFEGMGAELANNEAASRIFAQADEILGFDLSSILISGTSDELKQTK